MAIKKRDDVELAGLAKDATAWIAPNNNRHNAISRQDVETCLAAIPDLVAEICELRSELRRDQQLMIKVDEQLEAAFVAWRAFFVAPPVAPVSLFCCPVALSTGRCTCGHVGAVVQ